MPDHDLLDRVKEVTGLADDGRGLANEASNQRAVVRGIQISPNSSGTGASAPNAVRGAA
jgi:hypothetical protein